MEFRLLGPVEMRANGKAVPVGPPRQRLLLALLALRANQVVPTDRLLELVWPEGPPRTARTSIHVGVSRLRAAFASASVRGVLATHGSGYVLRVAADSVDAHRFRGLVGRARTVDDARAVGLLGEALRLWRGPPLDGVAADPLRLRLCRSLNEARLIALEDRAEAQLRMGSHHEVVPELIDLVEANPERERLAGALMLAHYRCGDTVAALQLYQRVRRHVAETLGIDPGPRLQRLHEAILRRSRVDGLG